jgi:hypothetical protein
MRDTPGSHSRCFILQRTLLRFWPLGAPGQAVKFEGRSEDKQEAALPGIGKHKEAEGQHEEFETVHDSATTHCSRPA